MLVIMAGLSFTGSFNGLLHFNCSSKYNPTCRVPDIITPGFIPRGLQNENNMEMP